MLILPDQQSLRGYATTVIHLERGSRIICTSSIIDGFAVHARPYLNDIFDRICLLEIFPDLKVNP